MSPAEKLYAAALALLLVTVAIVDTIWIRRDQELMPWVDSYTYLALALDLADDLRERPPAEYGSALVDASLVGRPPLFSVLTLPAIYGWGRSEEAALSVNLFFLAVLVLSTYGAGRICHGPAAGLLAALLVACYPPLVHLSRMYLPHYALPAIAALSLWLMLSLLERRSIAKAWTLGLVLAAGIWTHPYFACVSAVPAVATGVLLIAARRPEPVAGALLGRLSERLRDRFVLLGLLPAAVFALGAAALWYLDLASASLAQMRQMIAGGQDGIGFPSVPPSAAWYARTSPGALSNVLAAAAGGGVVAALLRRRRKDWVLLAGLVPAYGILSQVPVLAWIYFAAALPFAAVLSALAIAGLRPRRWRRIAFAAAAAAAVFSFGFVTWGQSSWSRPIAAALGAPLGDGETCQDRITTAFCPTPAEARPWPWEELTREMLANPRCGQRSPCTVMLVDFARSAPHAYNYFLVRERLRGTIRGVATPRRLPYNFNALLGDFVLYPAAHRTHSTRYSRASLKLLRSPPAEFAAAHEIAAEIELPSELGAAILLRRSERLTAAEAEAVVRAADLPDRDKAHGYLMLARHYSRLQRYPDSVDRYRQALEHLPGHFNAHLELARILVASGEEDAAVEQLQRARQLNPGSRRARAALRKLHRTLEMRAAEDPRSVDQRLQ